MKQAFNTKVIISGKYVELIDYEKPIFVGFSRNNKKKKNKSSNPEDKEKNKQRALRRTMTELRRLINSNEDELDKFITLTFDPKKQPKTTDIKYANSLFNKFIMRVRYKYPEFKYIAVPEYQKDIDFYGVIKPNGGNVHYHVLCNIKKRISIKELQKFWQEMGGIDIERIDRIKNLGIYVSKYLSKRMDDKRLINKKGYLKSDNLKNPEERIDVLAHSYVNKNKERLMLECEKKYNNEHTGEISHKFYKLMD